MSERDYSQNEQDLITLCRNAFDPTKCKSWVLFENGTCIFIQRSGNMREEAIEILKREGPVCEGSPSARFDVQEHLNLDDFPEGYMVSYEYPNMLSVVLKKIPDEEVVYLGLYGRSLREKDADAKELKIVHVEFSREDLVRRYAKEAEGHMRRNWMDETRFESHSPK